MQRRQWNKALNFSAPHTGGMRPKGWAHFMIALLRHEIGCIKGIYADDDGYMLTTGNGRETIRLPEGSTDAILAPYHIDRSKQFVRERFGKKILMESKDLLDAEQIADYIEMTRFPVPDDDFHRDTSGLPGLVCAADFIGQLADPDRMQKCTALFYEFSVRLVSEPKPGLISDHFFRSPYSRYLRPMP